MITRLASGLCVGFVSLVASGLAADAPIALPEVVVSDSREVPPRESWRYSQIPDFEILSDASDHATQRLVHDLEDFQKAVAIVWPAIGGHSPVPASLIICGKSGRFGQFLPDYDAHPNAGASSLSLRDHDSAAIVFNLAKTVLDIDPAAGSDSLSVTTGVQSTSPGQFSSVTSAGNSDVTPGIEVDFGRQIHREYIHFILGRTNPRPPPWLEEGLAQLFASITYSPTSIVVGALPEAAELTPQAAMEAEAEKLAPSDASGPKFGHAAQEQGFNSALNHSRLMDMDEMFAVKADSPLARQAVGSQWSAQCWLFVHLCLFGHNQQFVRPFIAFVARSSHEPITEALFKDCFGISYDDMLIEIRGYTSSSTYKEVTYKLHAGSKALVSEDITLRDASDAEVGRIKGDALRLAGRPKEAHLALIAPYVRGSRDADLLAALGADALAENQPDRAYLFLDRAVDGKTQRAQAYLQLGRLRLARAEKTPAAPNSLLSPEQLISVLTPLFAGKLVPPHLPQTYEAIAEAWLHAAPKPSADNLGIVTEGVLAFPNDLDLLYVDAVLHQKNGMPKEANKLAQVGSDKSVDPVNKSRFSALLSSLPKS